MLDPDSGLYRGQAPRIGGILGRITKGQAELQEWGKLGSPGDRMRSWKGCGVTGCVTHSFNKHSRSHGSAPDLGLTLGTNMNQA